MRPGWWAMGFLYVFSIWFGVETASKEILHSLKFTQRICTAWFGALVVVPVLQMSYKFSQQTSKASHLTWRKGIKAHVIGYGMWHVHWFKRTSTTPPIFCEQNIAGLPRHFNGCWWSGRLLTIYLHQLWYWQCGKGRMYWNNGVISWRRNDIKWKYISMLYPTKQHV